MKISLLALLVPLTSFGLSFSSVGGREERQLRTVSCSKSKSSKSKSSKSSKRKSKSSKSSKSKSEPKSSKSSESNSCFHLHYRRSDIIASYKQFEASKQSIGDALCKNSFFANTITKICVGDTLLITPVQLYSDAKLNSTVGFFTEVNTYVGLEQLLTTGSIIFNDRSEISFSGYLNYENVFYPKQLAGSLAITGGVSAFVGSNGFIEFDPTTDSSQSDDEIQESIKICPHKQPKTVKMSKFDKEHAVSLAPSTAPSTQEILNINHLVNSGTINYNSCDVNWVDVDCISNLNAYITLHGKDGTEFIFLNEPGGKYIAKGDCNQTLGKILYYAFNSFVPSQLFNQHSNLLFSLLSQWVLIYISLLGKLANCAVGLDDFNDLLPSIITPNLDSTDLPTVSQCVADYILESGCPPKANLLENIYYE